MNEVYITKSGKFLPNAPVDNEQMEVFLGKINDISSKAKRIVLRNNGIQTRYYAIDYTYQCSINSTGGKYFILK